MKIKASTWVWMVLLSLTLATILLGRQLGHGTVLVAAVLPLTLVKGHLVIDHFMGLRHTALHWRALVHCWLLLVLGAIALNFI